MLTVLLVIHLLVTIALVGIVLVQRSEGGVLGMGGGGGGVVSGRAAGNALTKTTWALGGLFFALSIVMAAMSNQGSGPKSILDDPALAVPAAPAQQAPAEPAVPAPPAR